MRAFVMLLLGVASGCSTTTSGISPSRDPGPPDARWRIVSTHPIASVRQDPGVLACAERERHSYEHAKLDGWSDRCGWRRHTTCTESYNLALGPQRSCDDTTPVELMQANLELHVRRVFAASEPCDEDAATLQPLNAAVSGASGRVRESSWRVTGCGRRARIACRPGIHASGYLCERLDFKKESAQEALDEVLGHYEATGDRAACKDVKVVGGGAEPTTLPDGRPGLTVALLACGSTALYTCLRPDLVPPDERACRETPLDPGFGPKALSEARARVEKDHGCGLAANAVTLIAERVEPSQRVAILRVTSCNATRDVRTVRCRSASLLDATVKGCALDSTETETRLSLLRAGELAGDAAPRCGPEVRRAALVSAAGDRHLVHVQCFGTDRPPLYFECRRDPARDDATCERADAIHDAAAAMELGARERFQREELCPADKTRTSGVEPHGQGTWRARASGCGVTRDYSCKSIADPITRCSVLK